MPEIQIEIAEDQVDSPVHLHCAHAYDFARNLEDEIAFSKKKSHVPAHVMS